MARPSTLARWATCVVAAAVLSAVMPASPASADTFVRVYSGEGSDDVDDFNDVSADNGQTWVEATVVTADPNWATIANTEWISSDSSRGDPARANSTTLFRRQFSLPPGVTTSTGTLCIHADNAVTVTYNGATIVEQTNPSDVANFQGEPSCGSVANLSTSGVNTIMFSVVNGAGAMGIDFEMTMTYAQDPAAPPVLRLPGDLTVAATSPTGTTYGYGDVFAIDVTGQSIRATCTPAPGSFFTVGETEVTCTATGTNNQVVSGSFTITVTPFVTTNQPPVLALPGNVTVQATSTSGKRVTYSATATDDSGIQPTVVCVPPSGSLFPVGVTTVTCTATDNEQAQSSGSFTITVVGPLERACSLLRESLGITLKTRLVTKLKAAADALYQARRSVDSTTIRSLAVKVKNSPYTYIKPALRQYVVYVVRKVMDRACVAPA